MKCLLAPSLPSESTCLSKRRDDRAIGRVSRIARVTA